MTQEITLKCGLPGPVTADAAWGCRAIFHGLRRTQKTHRDDGRRMKHPRSVLDVDLDYLYDRKDCQGDDGHKKALCTWLDLHGLKLLRKALVKQGIDPADEQVITLSESVYTLRASPRKSYGYLYVTATMNEVTP